MTSREFCYWLQGFFEVSGSEPYALDSRQVGCIQRHLALVFKHEIDPSAGGPEHQEELNTIHDAVNVQLPKPSRPDGPFGPKLRC